jgi:hypothetical protein
MPRPLRIAFLSIMLAASRPVWAADLSGTWSLDGGG